MLVSVSVYAPAVASVEPVTNVNVAAEVGAVIVTLFTVDESVSAPVIVVAGLIVTAPVETVPIPIVPATLASIVKFSLVPEDRTLIASPLPAAAPLIFNPVATLVAEVSTLNVGFVVPFGPTVKALVLAASNKISPEVVMG